MNKIFYQLSQEKQNAIITAGHEVFGKFDYKRASTELIAAKAGISKGLLFYYFHNKLEYFKYIYTYSEDLMRENIDKSGYTATDDFFESLEIITKKKCSLLKDNPYILDFLVGATCSKDEKIQEIVKSVAESYTDKTVKNQLQNIDFTKFKDDVNPQDIIEMLSFALEGYLQYKLKNNEPMDIDQIMQTYKTWTEILKKSSYNKGVNI